MLWRFWSFVVNDIESEKNNSLPKKKKKLSFNSSLFNEIIINFNINLVSAYYINLVKLKVILSKPKANPYQTNISHKVYCNRFYIKDLMNSLFLESRKKSFPSFVSNWFAETKCENPKLQLSSSHLLNQFSLESRKCQSDKKRIYCFLKQNLNME